MKFINYGKYKLVIDPDISFIQLQGCYKNGCNCDKCSERKQEGCLIDEVDIDSLLDSIDMN